MLIPHTAQSHPPANVLEEHRGPEEVHQVEESIALSEAQRKCTMMKITMKESHPKLNGMNASLI